MRGAMEMKLGATKELGSFGPYRAWFKRELSCKSVSSNRAPITGNYCHTERSPQLPSFRVINVGARLKTVI